MWHTPCSLPKPNNREAKQTHKRNTRSYKFCQKNITNITIRAIQLCINVLISDIWVIFLDVCVIFRVIFEWNLNDISWYSHDISCDISCSFHAFFMPSIQKSAFWQMAEPKAARRQRIGSPFFKLFLCFSCLFVSFVFLVSFRVFRVYSFLFTPCKTHIK